MDKRITPTQKAIDCLIKLGYEMTGAGGSGFIMPRYWMFKRPDGSNFIACKTKTLMKELTAISPNR